MLLPSLLPAFRSHSSQISLIGTSTEAAEHFPVGKSAKDDKSQQKGGEQKGHPTAAKREGLDFCERPGFKTHKASSLRPNPNRKFVTNLANMHVQLQEVAHHSEKMKNHHFLTGGRESVWNKRSVLGQSSKCTKLVLGARELLTLRTWAKSRGAALVFQSQGLAAPPHFLSLPYLLRHQGQRTL